jgi:hypothetical protein
LAVHRKGSSIRIQLAFEKRVPVKPVRLSRMTLFSRACAFGVDTRDGAKQALLAEKT